MKAASPPPAEAARGGGERPGPPGRPLAGPGRQGAAAPRGGAGAGAGLPRRPPGFCQPGGAVAAFAPRSAGERVSAVPRALAASRFVAAFEAPEPAAGERAAFPPPLVRPEPGDAVGETPARKV